ncbi:MAG: hypothetical protein WA840_12800, partial [Caulobacteraceae bacterium]
MGDLGVDFETLRDQTRQASEGMGVNYLESQRLANVYVKAAGDLSAHDVNDGSFRGELDTAYGVSSAYGVDPDAMVKVFGQMRALGVDRSVSDTRDMALTVADAIQRSGYAGKGDEIAKAIGDFAQTSSRLTLSTPNVVGYATGLSSLIGQAPGLDPAGAAAALNTADTAVRHGGADGQASHQMIAAALESANPRMDALSNAALMQGGLFATVKNTFGGSLGNYGFGSGGSDHLGDDVTNVERIQKYLRVKTGANREEYIKRFSAATGLGLSAAATVDTFLDSSAKSPTLALAKEAGIDMAKVDPTSLPMLAEIAAPKSPAALQDVYGALMNRGDISEREKADLGTGLKGGGKALQEAMMRVASAHPQEDGMAAKLTDLNNTQIKFGGGILDTLHEIARLSDLIAQGTNKDGYVRGEKEKRDMEAKKALAAADAKNAKTDFIKSFSSLQWGLGPKGSGKIILAKAFAEDRKVYDQKKREAHGAAISPWSIVQRPQDSFAIQGLDTPNRLAWERDNARAQQIRMWEDANSPNASPQAKEQARLWSQAFKTLFSPGAASKATPSGAAPKSQGPAHGEV